MARTLMFSSLFFLMISLPYLVDSYDFLKPEVQSIYIKGVLCNASEKYIHKNLSCFSKSYNRSFSTLNVIGTTKLPLNNLHLSAHLHYKYGTIYREVMKATNIDVCKIAEGLTADIFANKLVAFIYNLLENSAPGLFHRCPYTGLDLRNCNAKTKDFPSIFPAGDYRLIIGITENSEFVSTANIIGTMISPLKENFGRK